MMYFDDSLQQLQNAVARQKQLTAFVRELKNQRRTLREQVEELLVILHKEQLDVDRLEKLTPAALIARIRGTRERQLEQEQLELCAASAKYTAAAKELKTVEQTLAEYEQELISLEGCRQRYETALAERARAIKFSALAGDVLGIEKAIGELKKQIQELDEAISAGNAALAACDQVQKDLGRAAGWSTWDVFGGSVIADMGKYCALDDAQSSGQWLQAALRRFKTEVADVDIPGYTGPYIDSSTKAADYFFNSLFFDLSVHVQIQGSVSEADVIRRQVLGARSKLEQMKADAEEEMRQLKSQLSQLLIHAKGKE